MKKQFTKVPDVDDGKLEELVARLADDYIRRLGQGEDPSVEEYVAQYPEASGIIRRTLGALKTMRTVDLSKVGLGDEQGPDAPARTVGDFQLIRIIGQGGMGVVYEANQLSLHRRVALKVLPYAGMLDERAINRFRNEVMAAAQLDHPNIVPVYGVGCDRGVHHYAMRLIEGVSLADTIHQLRELRDQQQGFPDSIGSIGSVLRASKADSGAELSALPFGSTVAAQYERDTVIGDENTLSSGTLSWENVRQPISHFRSIASLAATIAEALDNAHHNGVIHRDVKPSNLMIDGSGKAWITDFGLAQVETGTALTMTGDLLGTARYMSPEQLMAKRLILDHRTDIYSLGITLFEMLTLQTPFDSENRQELFRQIMLEPPKHPRKINPGIPKDLETVVLKCIEKNADDRYQTAQELADDLNRYTRQEPITARKSSLAAKARKWAQRNTAFVSGAISVLTFSIMAMAASLAFLISERGAKSSALQAAQMEQRRATENFDFALGILQDFLVSFADADLAKVPGAERQRQSLLRQTAGRLDEMVAGNPESDKLRRASADVLFKLGEASLGIDDALAENCYKRCIDLGLVDLADSPPPELQQKINRQIADSYMGRAKAVSLTRPAIAEQYFDQALQHLRSQAGSDVSKPESLNAALADVLIGFSDFLANNRRDDEAIKYLEEALDVGPDSIRGLCFYGMARIQFSQQRFNDAIALVEQALASSEGMNVKKRNYLALKARILFEQGNIEEAKKASGSAIGAGRTIMGEMMTKPFADWLIDQLQFDAQLASRLNSSKRQLKMLEQALALHMTYNNQMLDEFSLKTRRDIQKALADAQDAVGQTVTAIASRERVGELEQMIERVSPKQNGITFPLGTASDENLSCVAIDNEGYVYVAGTLSRGTDLQPGYEFQNIAENESGSVIAKYSTKGELVWSCPVAGMPAALGIDNSNNVFVKGVLWASGRDTAQFGDVDKRLPSDRKYVGYLAKTDANGRVLWVQWVPVGSTRGLYFDHSIAVSREGSVIVGGTFHSDFKWPVYPPVILRARKNADSDSKQGYVAKFSAAGQLEWARSIDADKSNVGGVDIDPDGNIYLCGIVEPAETAFFGVDKNGLMLQVANVNNGLKRCGFLAKLDPDGKTNWVQPQTSEDYYASADVAAGPNGKVYLTIALRSDVDLNGTQDHEDGRDRIKFEGRDFWDSNLSCWDSDGQLLWNLPLNNEGYVSAYSLACSSSGNVFVTGRAAGSDLNFGGNRITRHPPQGRDGFIASISDDGAVKNVCFYTTYMNHSSAVVPWAISVNDHDQVAVVGRIRGSVRTPTGEVLREPFAFWDGFVTILSEKK